MAVQTRRRVKSKVKKAICVRADCDQEAATGCRGNCSLHFNQFRYAKSLLKSPREKTRFDDQQVAAGNIMPSARGKIRKQQNPYLKSVV